LVRKNPLGGKRARKRQRKSRKQLRVEASPFTPSGKARQRSTALVRYQPTGQALRASLAAPPRPMENLPVATLDENQRYNCPICRRINHDVSTWGETHDCDHCGQRVKIKREETDYRRSFLF